MIPLLLLVFLSILVGCQSAVITIRSNYDFNKIRRTALLNFEDFPKMENSGELVSSIFEKYLLKSGFELVERRKLKQLLQEGHLETSGMVETETAKKLGKLLGVDALFLGTITVFSPQRKNIVLIDIREERREPVIKKKRERVKEGEKWAEIEKEEIVGYTTVTRLEKVPQTYTTDAEVGVAVRMVDVETGEIVLVASASEVAFNTQVAAEIVSSRIVNSIKKNWTHVEKN